jgi:hypothetical protein
MGGRPKISPTPAEEPAAVEAPAGEAQAAVDGAPILKEARIVAKDCYQATNNIKVRNPGGANTLLVVRLENGNGAKPAVATFAGFDLKLVREDKGYKGVLLSYILANPPAGEGNLAINFSKGGCSWNVAVEFYAGVDQGSPVGAASSEKGAEKEISVGLATKSSNSLVSAFMAIENVDGMKAVELGAGQKNLKYKGGCCETVFGCVKPSSQAGQETLSFGLEQEKRYASQLLEIRGAGPGAKAAAPRAEEARPANAPKKLDARLVGKGCVSENPYVVDYEVPEGGNLLLLVRIMAGGSATELFPAEAVTYSGKVLKLFRADKGYNKTRLLTSSLAGPATGNNELKMEFKDKDKCNWNIVAETWANVDQAKPLGAASSATGKAAPHFATKLTTLSDFSVLDDFLQVANVATGGVQVTLGRGQENQEFESGCCEEIYGSWKSAGKAGAQALTYALNQEKDYTSQLIEIRSAGRPEDEAESIK